MLARHLSRLGDTLETFGSRLREAVSSAIGETVSGIVRETVRALLEGQPNSPTSSGRLAQPAPPSRPLWREGHHPDEEPWLDDRDAYPHAGDYDDPPPVHRAEESKAPFRLPRALATGLHTTLCWLRRSVGRYPVMTAVGVGLLTALATYAGGPLAAALVGVVGSAFNLLSLAEAVQTGAGMLGTLRRP
jgi:hypothetical protein